MKKPVGVEECNFFCDDAHDQLEDDDVKLRQDVDVRCSSPFVQLVREVRERQVDNSLKSIDGKVIMGFLAWFQSIHQGI